MGFAVIGARQQHKTTGLRTAPSPTTHNLPKKRRQVRKPQPIDNIATLVVYRAAGSRGPVIRKV